MHCGSLLFSHLGIGIDAKHKGKEDVYKMIDPGFGKFRKKLFQTLTDQLNGPAVRLLELYQHFRTGVFFHIIMIHRHEFEQQRSFLKRFRQCICKFIRIQRFVRMQHRIQISAPTLIFLTMHCKEYLPRKLIFFHYLKLYQIHILFYHLNINQKNEYRIQLC